MDKKEEILLAAYHLFTQKGCCLSMSEIANMVGIKTPSIYSHFKSKDEIIELVIKSEITGCYSLFSKEFLKLKGKSCEEILKSVLFFAINYYKQCGRLRFWKFIRLTQNKELQEISKALTHHRDHYFANEIKKCLALGVKNKEVREGIGEGAMFLYLAMVQGVVDSMLLYQQVNTAVTIEEYALKSWEAYWDGIKFSPNS